MKLYADYIREREGFILLELEGKGFLTYKIEGKFITVGDIYVSPEYRGYKTFRRMADEVSSIGRENGCEKILCQVWLNTDIATLSARSILAYGCKIINAHNGRILFEKEL